MIYNSATPSDRQTYHPSSILLLTQPHSGALHPLQKRLRLLACKVCSRVTFWGKLQKLSCTPGQLERRGNKNLSLGNGLAFVRNLKLNRSLKLEPEARSRTLKVAMLSIYALVTAHGCQTMHMLQINFMRDTSSSLEFILPDHIKQSRLVIVRRHSASKALL